MKCLHDSQVVMRLWDCDVEAGGEDFTSWYNFTILISFFMFMYMYVHTTNTAKYPHTRRTMVCLGLVLINGSIIHA